MVILHIPAEGSTNRLRFISSLYFGSRSLKISHITVRATFRITMLNFEGAHPDLKGKEMALGSSNKGNFDGSSERNLPTLRPGEFEKMYMSPASKVDGNLRSIFGNPTPL